jgi:hypothetical protein
MEASAAGTPSPDAAELSNGAVIIAVASIATTSSPAITLFPISNL